MQLRTLYEKTKQRYRLKCIAGEVGMCNDVRWIHVLEDIDCVNFIRGNELIITTGVCSKDAGWEKWLPRFLEALRERHVCGIIVNLGEYIPKIPLRAVEFGARNNFPIIAMPWEVHIVDIVRDLCDHIFEDRQALQTLSKAFLTAFSEPDSRGKYIPYLDANGFDQKASYCVLSICDAGGIIADKDRTSDLELYIGNKLNRLPICYHMLRSNDKICIILRSPNSERDTAALADIVLTACKNKIPGGSFSIGVGSTIQSLENLNKSYARSLSALKYCEIACDSVCFFEHMGLYRLLLSVNDGELLPEMMDETLGWLIEYDKKNNTDLTETLRLYMLNNFSVKEVSALTHVHRNTVNYRIRKIKEILRNEMETMDEKLKIQLAFHIHNLL